MDFRTLMLLSIALPAFVSGLNAALAALPPAKDAPAAAFRAGLGMMVGFWIGWAVMNGLSPQNLPWLPREAAHWLLWVPAAAALAALCFAFMTEGAGRVILKAIVVAALAIPMVRPLWKSSWQPIESVWITALILGVGVVGWSMLSRIAREVRPAPAMIWFTALLACTAGAVMASGSASLAQTTGIFAAVLGPLVLIAWWRPESGVFGIAPALTALALLGVLINARCYSDLNTLAVLLILASPLLTWALVRLGPTEGVLGSGWTKCLIGILPAAAAAGLAIRAAMMNSGEKW